MTIPVLHLPPTALVLAIILRVVNDITSGFGLETSENMLQRSYDFIIVGGGSAGCAVASRLSENPAHSVLLLELGAGFTPFSQLPSLNLPALTFPYNTYYDTQSQQFNCLGYRNRRCRLLRGTNLGGSSAINYMIYTRGNRKDFDKWEEMGNIGWGYSDVLPYFKKMEDMKDPILAIDEKYHSTGGPVAISKLQYTTPLATSFLQAGKENGYPIVDYNAENQTGGTGPLNTHNSRLAILINWYVTVLEIEKKEGFGLMQGYFYRGRRSDAAWSYIHPHRQRKNLHMSFYTRVIKILIDESKRAYGVEVMKEGRRKIYISKKEVIVSAGTLETPKLLKLSGIGPKKELEIHKISLIQDLPVGLEMSSAFAFIGLIWSLLEDVGYALNVYANPNYWKEYFHHRTGFITAPSGAEGAAFINTKYQQDKSYPDIYMGMRSNAFVYDGGLFINPHYIALRKEVYEGFTSLVGKPAFTLLLSLTRPKSRGQIFLSSANPMDQPFIRTNYLKNPDDMKVLIEGVKEVIKIGNSASFRKFGAQLHPLRLPACQQFDLWTDEHIQCCIRQLSFTRSDDVGTARMGPTADAGAVVDHRLRVYGVRGLRVVDASVIPELVAGSVGTAVYMIAEKAADMIKQDWHVTNTSSYAEWPTNKLNNSYHFSYD